MKTIIFKLLSLFTLILFISACSKDAEDTLPGTWKTSDGGSITFNEDGTGMTMDSEFFLWDCGTLTLNGQSEYFGPVTVFEWQVTEGGDNLLMEFDDQTSFSQPCSGSMEFPVNVKSKNKAKVGASAFGFSLEVELTR